MGAEKLYTLDYSKPSGYVRIGEYDVPLPAKPARKEMINFGLPDKDQYFQKTETPVSLRRKKSKLTKEEMDWIFGEYHKRHHGVWMLINGKEIYITGPYYDFLNYWITKNGVNPGFRYEQCLVYQFWDMVVRDPNCYGMIFVKPRRVGGTEFTLHLEYEYATRVRNVACGMQSKNDKSAYINFKRLTKAHKKRAWFMKPIHKGSDDPEESLEFKYPVSVNTAKKMKEEADNGIQEESQYEFDELGSAIDYRPSVDLAYDGEELNRWILNEFGKLEKMSAKACWDIVKPCLHYDNGLTIVGKAMFESTIEEINDEQILELLEMWEDSDPKKLDANGRTSSGLFRLFLSAVECSNHDEHGFPRSEETLKFLQVQFDELSKKGKIRELAKLKRKTPLSIEDALTPSGNQSAFNRDRLQETFKLLQGEFDENGNPYTIRGDFKWVGGVSDSKVYFEPNHEGKFLVRTLLKDGEDNAQVIWGGVRYPAATHKSRGGCDPYEHDEVADISRASKGAGVIMGMYDDLLDGAKIDNGMPADVAWGWEGYVPWAIYVARPDDPDEFFEDMLMMHVYYGTQMLVENNKQSIKKHFKKRGYGEYLMLRPQETIAANSKQAQTTGIAATTDTIEQYFSKIASYIMNYCNGIKFIDLVKDLLEMNKKNRTKHDLGVAFGWALIACDNKQLKNPKMNNLSSEEEHWFDEYEI